MIASKELILLAAKASQLAYGSETSNADAQAMGLSIAAVLHDEKTDTQGVVLVNDELVIVAFRGTESTKDWLTDVKVKRLEAEHDGIRFGIHSGFYRAYQSICQQLTEVDKRIILDLNGRKVVFTGHSLGAALAMVCAAGNPNIKCEVITFGGPRIGDGRFKRFYNDYVFANTTRVINGLDVICLSPPWLMGYRHAGKHVVFIDASGEVLVNPDPFTKLISHAICVIKDWMHIRWVNLGGFNIPLPFRLSAARNHFMRDYLNQLEAWK